MNSQRKAKIESLVLEARKVAVDEHIHAEDIKLLTRENVECLIWLIRGRLSFASKNEDIAIVKKNVDTDRCPFTVDYTMGTQLIHLMEAFALAFLHLQDMKVDQTCSFKDVCVWTEEAKFFARAYMMPSKLFEETVAKHLKSGEIVMQDVADEFGVDCLDVIERGKDLHIWK